MRKLHVFAFACFATSLAFAQTQSSSYAFTTIAGRAGTSGSADGAAADARFNRPFGVTVDSAGNVFVTEGLNHLVRKISPDGIVSTVAGRPGVVGLVDGVGSDATFGGTAIYTTVVPLASSPTGPFGIALLPGGTILVAESHFHVVRQISPAREVSTFFGTPRSRGATDGMRAAALFDFPVGLASDSSGAVFVADTQNHTIRRISAAGVVTTLAGFAGQAGSADGIGSGARFFFPTAIAVAPSGNIYVADCSNVVRKLTRYANSSDTWEATTLAGTAFTFGSTDGNGSAARFGGATPSTMGSVLVRGSFIPQQDFRFEFRPGESYVIGDLVGLAVDAAENVYVADLGNNLIRKISASGVVTTIGGSTLAGATDGVGTNARFNRPAGIAVDAKGAIYIADSFNQTIRKGEVPVAPVFRSQPSDLTVGVGETITLSVDLTGAPAPAIQWRRNGAIIAGATQGTLTLNNVQTTHAGTYTVTATNVMGIATSVPFVLTVANLPVIATQPLSQTVNVGQTVTLRVVAAASPAPSYQWLRDGTPINGATSATFSLSNVPAAAAGDYTVVITNSFGSVTSAPARLTINGAKLVNLSIRSALVGDEPLIVGFVASGGSKTLLVRAVGPTLREFGVGGAMADPLLSLHRDTAVAASNDNWSSSASVAAITQASAAVGAFALPANSLDAAFLANVDASMTAQAVARNATGGIVLVELYDAAPGSASRLVNVSARTRVGQGENALFAGFVISGNVPRTMLIRAIGPTLTAFGLSGVLQDPRLDVFRSGETTALASNDNWGGAGPLVNAFTTVAAFPLPSAASRDAALLVTLNPGAYSAQISGVGGTSGEALLEIYELP